MASFIPFPDCCEAAIEFDLDGIPCVNTLGFHNTASEPFAVTDLADLATVIQTYLITGLATDQAPIVQYRNIHLRTLDSVSGPVFDQPLTNAGSASGTPVPNQVSMTITFLSGIAGRSYRGRNYIAGLQASTLADQRTWQGSGMSYVQSVYETFDGHLPSVSAEHVILSRFLDKAPREIGHAQPVIGYRANSQVHTQRRRLT
jgi:hypothetical protein